MPLSHTLRQLTVAVGGWSALLGAVLFVAPGWSAREFPWTVTDFMAMTMGGWCLGNAFVAWIAVRNWEWSTNYALLVYLWLFALFEVAVFVWFRDRLRLKGLLAWPYVVMLAGGLLTAIQGALDVARTRPFPPAGEGPALNGAVRNAVLAFVVFVAFLGLFGLFATDFGASQRVFPEPLSPFTLRAFAVFYLALALGALAVLASGRLAPTLCYARAGLGLIVPITLAALVYLGRFDFSAHPGQVAYIAAYVLVGVAVLVVLAWNRRRQPPQAVSP